MPASDLTKRRVWVRCGGRCVICNVLLVEAHLDDSETVRAIGEVAHVAGESLAGPRGCSTRVAATDRNEANNLILLCPNHHRSADKRLVDPQYTESFLFARKADHEGFIEHATSLRDEARTTVLRMFGGIRTAPGNISRGNAAAVVMNSTGRMPYYLPDPNNVGLEINLHNIPDPIDDHYWQTALRQVTARVDQVHRDVAEQGTRHVSVFAIALLPVLVALGVRLDDTIDADVYERHRSSQSWNWEPTAQIVPFATSETPGDPDSTEAVLIINASGTIQPDELPDDVASLTIFTLAPADGSTPGPTTFDNAATLAAFQTEIRAFFPRLEEMHKHLRLLHVFAAAPVSAAVELGRALPFDNAAPALAVYHRADHTYHRALTLPQ